jgi:hypothetical protein
MPPEQTADEKDGEESETEAGSHDARLPVMAQIMTRMRRTFTEPITVKTKLKREMVRRQLETRTSQERRIALSLTIAC